MAVYLFGGPLRNDGCKRSLKYRYLIFLPGFIIIGVLKSYITQTRMLRGIAETLLLGVIAALVAYFIGDWLETIITRS